MFLKIIGYHMHASTDRECGMYVFGYIFKSYLDTFIYKYVDQIVPKER